MIGNISKSPSNVYGWGYQVFTAGDITTTSVTITTNSNGSNVEFVASQVVNNSAYIVRDSDIDTKPYTGVTALFSTQVKATANTNDAVTLSGVPHSSWGDLRIYYLYQYITGLPNDFTLAPKFIRSTKLTELDALFITHEEFTATSFDHGDLQGLGDDDHNDATNGYVLRELNGSVASNALTRWDGTDGRNLKNSTVLLGDSNTLTTSNTNGSISIVPNGTGDLILDQAKFPQTMGLADQYLKSDGIDQLSWSSIAAGVGGDTYKILISDSDTTADYASNKFTATSATNAANILELLIVNTSAVEHLKYQIDETKINHNNLNNYSSDYHFTVGSIDHTLLQNIGTTTHANIDSHIANSAFHFTVASIDHIVIQNIGTQTHAQIDSHIADTTIHYTSGSVDHGGLQGLGDDDHNDATNGYILRELSATVADNSIARWDGDSGRNLQNSNVKILDSDTLTGATTLKMTGPTYFNDNNAGFTEQTISYTSGTVNIDWTKSNKASLDFGAGNIATLTFSNPSTACNLILKLKQDTTGSRVVSSWDSDIKWPSGTAPTLTTSTLAEDVIAFYFNGTSYYGIASKNFS